MTSRPQAIADRGDKLFLLFRLGADRYALAADCVVEVLPKVDIKALPGSPAAIAGLIDYRGRSIPVVDIGILALGRPAQPRLSTRILLCHYENGGGTHWLGLIAEQATEMMRRQTAAFQPSDVDNTACPWLGPVTSDPRGLIQWIDHGKLRTPAIRDMLVQPIGGVP